MFVFNLKVISVFQRRWKVLKHNPSATGTWNVFHVDMNWDLSVLLSFSKAVESLAQGGDAEVQHGKEAQKKMQEMEEMLTGRINLLEEVSDHSWRNNKKSLLSLYCYLRCDTVVNLYFHNVFFNFSLSVLEMVYSCIYCWAISGYLTGEL